MSKFPKKLLFLAVALCLSGSAALADTSKDEAAWQRIKAYANVTISEDSVLAWGPWAEFAPTAAGPSFGGYTPITGSGPDAYRPLGNPTGGDPTPIAGACAPGSLCGYGAYFNISREAYGGGQEEYSYAPQGRGVLYQGPFPTRIDALLAEGDESAMLTLSFAQLNALDPLPFFPSTGTMNEFSSGERYLLAGNDAARAALFSVGWYDRDRSELNVDTLPDVALVFSYISGQDFMPSDVQSLPQALLNYGVVGLATSSVDMAALRANGMIANYGGSSLAGLNPVSMTVDFGRSTWTGSWNGGQDGLVRVNYASGSPVLQGQVGFNVTSGQVSGAAFSSSALSALDGQVSGRVVGNFVGANAGLAIGVTDITKTKTPSIEPTVVSRPPQTYTDARLVQPFVVVQGSTPGSGITLGGGER